MDPDEEAIQAAVDQTNALVEGLMDDYGPEDAAQRLIEHSHLLHYHEPWDAAFMVMLDDEPAPVISEAFDAFFVSDEPRGDPSKRRRVDLEKVGTDPPITAHYRPDGHDGPTIDVEWHPIEDQEGHLWRGIAGNGEPMPDLKLAMLSMSDRHPKDPEELADDE